MSPAVGPGRLASDTIARSPEYSSLLGVPASVPFSVSTPFVDAVRIRSFTCPQDSSIPCESRAVPVLRGAHGSLVRPWTCCPSAVWQGGRYAPERGLQRDDPAGILLQLQQHGVLPSAFPQSETSC